MGGGCGARPSAKKSHLAEYSYLFLHNDVRQLSRDKLLQRSRNLLLEIEVFLYSRDHSPDHTKLDSKGVKNSCWT